MSRTLRGPREQFDLTGGREEGPREVSETKFQFLPRTLVGSVGLQVGYQYDGQDPLVWNSCRLLNPNPLIFVKE